MPHRPTAAPQVTSGPSLRGLAPAVLACAGAFSLYRGLRWPNDWAEAHWLISYRFGFLKRGLPGTLLEPFVEPGDGALTAIRAVTAVLSVGLWAALFFVALRGARAGGGGLAAALVFLTSPFMVYLAHLNGYYDIPILLLILAAVHLVFSGRILWAALVLAPGVLVHETILVLGLPAAVMALLLSRSEPAMSRAVVLRGALLCGIPLAVAAVLVWGQSVSVDVFPARKEMIKHLAQYPFVAEFRHVIVPEAFTTSIATYYERQGAEFAARLTHPFALQAVPPLLALLWWSVNRLRRVPQGRAAALVLVAGSILPLGMHAIAWDTERIWTYPLIAAFLGVWITARTTPRHTEPWLPSAILIALAGAQAIPAVPFMDQEVDNLGLPVRIAAGALIAAAGWWVLFHQRRRTR